jgi:hypothetical protein
MLYDGSNPNRGARRRLRPLMAGAWADGRCGCWGAATPPVIRGPWTSGAHRVAGLKITKRERSSIVEQARHESVSEQIEELRAAIRRLKRALSAALFVPAAVLLVGSGSKDRQGVVEASQFILKGADGAIQAKLYENDKGLPALALYDKGGKPRLEARLDDLGVGLFLNDEDGFCNAELLANTAGATHFHVAEPNGKWIFLCASAQKPDHEAELVIGDVEGPGTFFLRSGKDATTMTFAHGVPEANLTLGSDSNGADIRLLDKNGKQGLIVEVDAAGNAGLRTTANGLEPAGVVPRPAAPKNGRR